MRLVLDVYLDQRLIGKLIRKPDGSVQFQYVTDSLPHALSLSLPVQEAAFSDHATRSFFENLLFENAQRDQIMQRYGLDYNDVAGLLYHLGGDCPGSVSCVPEGAPPAKLPGLLSRDYDVLPPEELWRIMRSLRDHRRVPDDSRDPSTLAGVQGKVALTVLADGRYAMPKPGLKVPTTHILKVPRPGEMVMVAQEDFLMRQMAALQPHPVAQTRIVTGAEDLQGLLITRFDRVVSGDEISRLHQEDFAQALGLGPQLKYQRYGHSPHWFSSERIGHILAQTNVPGRARQAFLEVSLLNLIFGNTDNHAKNHALLYRSPRPEFAPIYDVAPILIDSTVTHQLSFDIGLAQMTEDISPEDLTHFIGALGFPRVSPALHKRLQSLIPASLALLQLCGGPKYKRLGDMIIQQCGALLRALSLEAELPEHDLVPINRP